LKQDSRQNRRFDEKTGDFITSDSSIPRATTHAAQTTLDGPALDAMKLERILAGYSFSR
jgi:hypothetical protein